MVPVATNRQAQLLDDLVDLILAEGFLQFTLDDLASRLHCSKTTLYALGGSKEQVTVNAVKHFFQRSAEEVERRAEGGDPPERIVAYLRAVADALRPASAAFVADLAALPPAARVYDRNTQVASERVAGLIDEGVSSGHFRHVHAAFVADTVTATMRRIHKGHVLAATGLSAAEAYDELAELILRGIRTDAS
ncbi:MAG: TetR/AcrR family transcriptional regulator [Actinobacteria bacterium]|nr:TetR/AcrR family transcriptional regulator [Actinomycetota bacterium]